MRSRPGPRVVLHLLGSLDRAGAELTTLDLLRRTQDEALAHEFLCLSGRVGALAEEFEAAGARVDALRVSSPLFLPRFATLLLRRRPGTVVSHVSLASGALLLVAMVVGTPRRLARMHSDGDGRGASRARWGYRASMRLLLAVSAHEVLAVTTAAAQFASSGPGATARLARRTRVLPNGVDTDRFRPDAGTGREVPPVVLHIGRSDEVKNRPRLLGLADGLAAAGLRLRLISSDGYADLTGRVPETVELLDARADVVPHLREASVLVLPSTREGLPGVVLEALATGTPVVATDLAGLREIAARLPGLTLVGLAEPDEAWMRALAGAVSRPEGDAVALHRAVVGSCFDLDTVVGQWRAALTG